MQPGKSFVFSFITLALVSQAALSQSCGVVTLNNLERSVSNNQYLFNSVLPSASGSQAMTF